jgi:phospholipase C
VPGDFTRYGFRLPFFVASPFAKKGYVSHTPADATAILKFIEQRFNLPALTNRDAAQPDMREFFDFNNPPWLTPPTNIPTQPTTGPCNYTNIPQ